MTKGDSCESPLLYKAESGGDVCRGGNALKLKEFSHRLHVPDC
jgi:hypothetical protein